MAGRQKRYSYDEAMHSTRQNRGRGKRHYNYSLTSQGSGEPLGMIARAKDRSSAAQILGNIMRRELAKGKTVSVGYGRERVSITHESEDADHARSKFLRRERVVNPDKGRTRRYPLKPKKNPSYLPGRGMPDFSPPRLF